MALSSKTWAGFATLPMTPLTLRVHPVTLHLITDLHQEWRTPGLPRQQWPTGDERRNGFTLSRMLWGEAGRGAGECGAPYLGGSRTAGEQGVRLAVRYLGQLLLILLLNGRRWGPQGATGNRPMCRTFHQTFYSHSISNLQPHFQRSWDRMKNANKN